MALLTSRANITDWFVESDVDPLDSMRADIVASNFDDVSWRQTGAKRRCLTIDSDGVCRDEIVGFAPRDTELEC